MRSRNKKSSKKRKVIIVSAIVLCSVAAVIVGAFTADMNTKKIKDDEALITPSISSQNPSQTASKNELTGLDIEQEYVKKRPVAVMINNIDQAQPLLGVFQADIMYECLVEGGITRIMAVFKNPYSVSVIGSVRSARPYFINIANGLNAVYMHVGGSTEALEMLKNGIIDEFDLGNHSDMMWRDQTRMNSLGYEHSAVTSGKMLHDGISSSGIEKDYQKNVSNPTFSSNSSVLTGTVCNKIKVNFSWYKDTEFTYDQASKSYLISQFSKPQTDGNSNAQNSKKNILALYVNTYSMENSLLQQMDLVGNGTGFYASNGRVIPIKWSRKTLETNFEFKYENGNQLEMLPGQIYVCCVPLSGSIETS